MDLSVLIGAALTCIAGGFLPWINAEVVVVGASLLTPRFGLPLLVLACAVGQMSAKCAIYGLTRWAPERLPARAKALIARAERYRERPLLLAGVIFSGSLVALPPFYLVTLTCGTLRVPFGLFAALGLAGTITRYGFLCWVAVALGG